MDTFASRLLTWWDTHGRHDLPWQHPREPWRVWVAEVMLQQTQVATVIPYFVRFMARFPDIATLATADEDEVLAHWAGLGYYRRARFLHAAARQVVELHGGLFPQNIEAAMALPGLGRSTAAAILAQAYGLPHAILDGNVKRVLARYHGIEGWPGEGLVERALWHKAEAHTPRERVADYTQAIMDLGATLCTPKNPACDHCPQQVDCAALKDGRVGALPTPRPRKALPVRRTVMLLIEDEAGVLLERRPPVGVWPGLYSLPECSAEDAADCAERLGLVFGESLPVLRHTFSHYHLDIEPRRAHLKDPIAQVMDEGERLWYNPAHPPPGLPAPVQRIIQQYCKRKPT
jgi:A/G-specific adenine glycosylase